MIIKQYQPVSGLAKYARRSRYILAKRMTESFMAENGTGWISGKPGEWLVLIGADLWLVIAHEQFTRIFRSVENGAHAG